MGTASLIGSLCLLLALGNLVYGQVVDEDDTWRWTQHMSAFSFLENTPNFQFLYQLEATYKPNPSAELVYGLVPDGLTSDSIPQEEKGIWAIYPNGTVVLRNSGTIDRENPDVLNGVPIGFMVVLRSDPSIRSIKTRTISVLDDNDNDPVFQQKTLTAEVVENTVPPPGGTRLIQGIRITDVDTVTTGVRYINCQIVKCQKGTSLNESDCDGIFALRTPGGLSDKEYTGDFYIMKPLNYENATVWQITLQAYDGRHRPTQDVVVNVIDVQDLPPVWLYIPAALEHPDETPEETSLGYVYAEDGDGDVNKRRNISYSLIPTTDPNIDPNYYPEKYFRIDERTGYIYNKVKLDLESEPFATFSSWPINVKACEIINSTHIGTTIGLDCTVDGKTVVQITDINDNGPRFNSDLYEFTISEDVRNGENLELPNNRTMSVFDLDSDQYNSFTIRFEQPSDEFQLSSVNFAGTGTPIIQIKNTSLIDFDPPLRITQYRLRLIAVDDNDNRLQTSASVIINVLDANDNQPIFSQERYEEAIKEDAPEGLPITTIRATDIDTGLMGTAGIRFSFAPGNPHARLFDINAETGLVTVASCATPGVHDCLDYEYKPNTYNFKVSARDELGLSQRTSYATLIINILDVNDNPPQVGNYIVDIYENRTVTQPPLKIIATDADNDRLQYRIASQPVLNGIAYWQIDKDTGDVTATRPIKYEYAPRDGKFELKVEVTDGNRTAISEVTINVLDINDNAPRFQPVRYVIEIPESTPGDVYLLDVFAVDDDDPTTENGKIDYGIQSGDAGQFQMQGNGSFLTAPGAQFEYEEGQPNEYTVIVVATDRGSPRQLSGSGTVIVRITDENNKNPYFFPFSRRFQVYDDQTPGTAVDFLTAKDPDQDSVLRFYLEAKEAITPEGQTVDPNVYDFRQLFRIDEVTARIYVNAPLDHNKASIVTLDSIVRDITPSQPQEGIGTVIIDILKVNKHPPIFANYSKEICLPEEQAKGTYVTSFIATDEDGAVAEFSIVEQPDDYFTISPQNGFVTINKAVDYDDDRKTNGSYFVVTVTDIGEPTLTATASVSVCFENINDNYPIFTENGKYVAEIDENLPDGEPVIQVFASDADRRDDKGYADIRYRMDDNRFDIEPETGIIRVRRRNGAELDRELTPTLVVQVIGYDTPNGPESVRKQRVASVIITLRDVNDNPPIFTEFQYEETIYEIIRPKTSFLTLYTTDDDLGLFGRVRYRKVPGVGNDTQDFFDVTEFGEVMVKRSVRGHVDTFTFQAEARDEDGSGPFRGYANITVHVLPAGNTAPIWVIPPRDNETIYVLEEQYNGMFIIDVSARDVDNGLNGVIDYMFIDGGKETQKTDAFQINPTTGVIHAEIIYDRETMPKYVLLLKAKDRGQTRLEATRFLTVVILDVNDNKPYFKETEMLLRVREDVPIGYEVKDPDANKKIEARDDDENPVIKYAIISGNEDDAFYLNEDTAQLYTNKLLNTKIKSIYNLDIQAYNPEPDYTVITSRRKRAVDPSILKLKILVGATNDEAPVFLGEPYYGCVSTRSSFDKSIITVSAVDYDAQGAGVVRYSLKDGPVNRNSQPIFGIEESFGILSNKVQMRDYADNIFKLTVNARDRQDEAAAEDANTTVTVYVTQPGKEAKLLITQNTAEVRLYQTQIQRIIEASNLSASDPGNPWRFHRLCINTVRDHVINTAGETSPVWSDVYISGIVTHKDTGETRIVSALELKNIIMTEMNKRPQDFDNLYIRTVEDESSEETSVKRSFVLIVMIIIGILILLALLFIILAYLCIRAAKQEKKSRLIQRTQAAPAPVPIVIEKQVEQQMEPAAVFEAQEPVAYDNRAFVIQAQGPPPVQETMVVEHEPEPVHVTYAVVDKTSRNLQPEVIQGSPDPVDTEDVIIVSQFRDDPAPAQVYQVDPQPQEEEYRIVTETM